MSHTCIRYGLATFAMAIVATLAPAQIKEPPRAEKLDIQIRYRIRADRDERVRQFGVLEKHLASLGFDDARKNDPDRDLDILDPTAERFTGTIPGAKVLRVLDDVRVQNILFAPAGFTYPDSPEKPVAVKIGLRGGYLPNVQQRLHKQVVDHLAQLGFAESLGYDNQGYLLIRGTIAYKSLDLLVRDIRFEPSGWFLPSLQLEKLPTPIRDRNPLRWVEVVPLGELAAPFSPAPVLPLQLKYSADLRAMMLNPATKDSPLRVEAIFENRVDDMDVLKTLLQNRVPGTTVEGVVGNIVALRLPRGAYVESLADAPGILGVRLPRTASETIALTIGDKGASVADAIKAAKLDELHKLGYNGAGIKVILIASDFTGAEKLIGTELPKQTQIVDFTTELNLDLIPFKADPTRLGSGVAAAKSLAAVAPACNLVLVRIDPGSLFHLPAIIRLARGEIDYTDALQVRLTEISNRTAAFEREKLNAITAYKNAFADLSDNEVAIALRKKTKADLDAVLLKEKEFATLAARFNAYQKDLKQLAGANVIVNTLVWESGYPLDSLSVFAGIVDQRANALPPRIVKRPGDPASAPPQPLVWVQAASNAGAQVWGGPFLDANRDGILEFAPATAKLAADQWTHTLNFLGTRAHDGKTTPELAAGTKLRLTVQWREPTDPNFPESDIPAYPLTLRLVRQLDPTGEKRSSDEMAEIARSVSVPNVIHRTRTYLVYEQMLEFTVADAGRYALMLESAATPDPLLPALRREVEVYPRIVLETLGTNASDPKVVFRSFTTPNAGVGTPGDALGAITVGTDNAGELRGGGTSLTLRAKPDVLGPGVLVFGGQTANGPGVATAFAGGAAAAIFQARASAPNVFFSAGIEPGKKLEIPATWLKIVPPADKRRP